MSRPRRRSLCNDVFNIAQNKQISGFSVPQELILAFSYQTPKLEATAPAA